MRRALAIAFLLAACRGDDTPAAQGSDMILEPATRGATSVDRVETETAGYVGVLAARDSRDLVAKFAGIVLAVSVKLGDHVEAGQELARLDDTPLRQELASAQAALKSSQTQVAAAEVDRKAAQAQYDIEKKARDAGISSGAELEAAKFKVEKAAQAVSTAYALVNEQRTKIDTLQAQVAEATLRAPVAGRIAFVYASQGAHVDAGQPLIRVISSDELYVRFAIPSEKLGAFHPGDPIEVHIEKPPVVAQARIAHVAPELDPVAQMILADAELVSPPAELQSGIVCRIVPAKR